MSVEARGLGLGARLALVCMACLVVVVSSAAALNAYYVNVLKEEMLGRGFDLAEEKGRQLATELAGLHRRAGAPGDSALEGGSGALQDQLRLFIERNQEIELALVVDGNLNVLVEDYRGPGALRDLLDKDFSEFRTEIAAGEDDALGLYLQRRAGVLPLRSERLEGESGLHLLFGLRESEIVARIADDMAEKGAQITRRASLMAGSASASLAVAFLFIWWHLRRQMRLQEENERLGRMAYVGALASGLAHEIRNPLNAMSVNLDVMEEDLADPRADSEERVRRILAHLRAEIGQLDGSVGGFLAYALPRERPRERVRLADAADAALVSLAAQLKAREIELRRNLDPGVEIEGDPEGLRQVCHNIALNAAQAMDAGERILEVKCWKSREKAHMSFADSGPGVPEQDRRRIFEPFFSERVGGSGFGLPIAERIVRGHGGRIRVESNTPRGSIFHLEFPLPERG